MDEYEIMGVKDGGVCRQPHPITKIKVYHRPRASFAAEWAPLARTAVLLMGLLFGFSILTPWTAAEKHAGEQVAKISDNVIDNLSNGLELRVPFYIYENPELNWQNATLDGKPYTPPEPSSVGAEGKHSDDYFLLQAALTHPMRTRDPERAQLFFVPTLLNSALQLVAQWKHRRGKRFCTNGRRNCFKKSDQLKLFTMVNQSLTDSPWFQRSGGKDHIIVASHWHSRVLGPEVGAIHMCNSLIFENEVPTTATPYDRVRLPGLYVGKACPKAPKKAHDFAMIASLKHDDPDARQVTKDRFQSRKDICDWLRSNPNKRNFTVGVCGRGKQCPSLANARYGFHVRGDTWGSNRLMDTLMSYTIPLFTNEEQYKILPSFYPWKDVSYLVNVTNKRSFLASIDDILSRPQTEYLDKIRLIKENMHKLQHKRPYQFDLHMAELARKLKLQT
jgi:hypothetical protein